MKKTFSILLLTAFLLTACNPATAVPQPPSSIALSSSESESTSSVDEEAPFPELFQLLQSDSTDNLQILVGDSPEKYSYRLTRELLTEIYDTILSYETEEVEPEAILSEYNPQFVDILYYASFVGPPDKGVNIIKQGDKTYLQLYGYETSELILSAPPELFDKVYSLATAESAPSKISFEGSYILLDTPSNPEGERYSGFFDADGRIVFEMGNNILAADDKTGEILFTIECGITESGISEIIRPVEYNGGVRILTETAVIDYDKAGKELARLKLPSEVISGLSKSQGLETMYRYDIVNDKIAYPTADGIYILESGKSRQILKNSDLISILSEKYDWFDKNDLQNTPSNFANPKLMADGTRLCAVVNMPNSQNGYMGLVFVNLETGEQKYFFDVFGVTRTGVGFLDDNTVLAYGQDTDTMFDVSAMTAKELKVSDYEGTSYFFSSNDQRYSFEERTYRDENGYQCRDIKLLSKDGENVGQKFLTIKDINTYLLCVTDNFLIYQYRDSEGEGIIAVPIPK